jgi:hypothetical protein
VKNITNSIRLSWCKVNHVDSSKVRHTAIRAISRQLSATVINNQSPITKPQLITNTQYSITKQKSSIIPLLFPVWVFGHWVLGINWLLMFGYWLFNELLAENAYKLIAEG